MINHNESVNFHCDIVLTYINYTQQTDNAIVRETNITYLILYLRKEISKETVRHYMTPVIKNAISIRVIRI